jgi:hypothetical protein
MVPYHTVSSLFPTIIAVIVTTLIILHMFNVVACAMVYMCGGMCHGIYVWWHVPWYICVVVWYGMVWYGGVWYSKKTGCVWQHKETMKR